MNAVEIEEAVSKLAEEPFDAKTFPFAFLEAFGNKATTIKKLKSGNSNKSDLADGVLQRNNIHLKVCPEGEVTDTLTALHESPATTRQKAKFILATDGISLEAENIVDGETVACEFRDFPDHFGFFLSLAGISTVKQIRENAFDIKATGRLNRLYVELLKVNPDWDAEDRREEMNHFMARLIFCFFAEDTSIFPDENLFTDTVSQMSSSNASNIHEVLSDLFLSMSTPNEVRDEAGIRNWAKKFPYVNGGLFSGSVEVPQFSKIARSYLLHVGNLDWTKINPDIFGSMIQAVADEEERGELGMHYTSVPNILKLLNPLFLDDLRSQLEDAGDNNRKLLNLRKRISHIRVFDPACGSGNFLVISYKEMRKIEAEINQRRGEPRRHSDIPLTNFRGIELRHFSAEIARLALIIAEYQTDVLYRGQRLALAEFLPLKAENWITCGNALRMDWISLCPPTGTGVKLHADDLFSTPLEQAEIDFENEGGETYICGNPPYIGSREQGKEQKEDLKILFEKYSGNWKSLDYVVGWLIKASNYLKHVDSAFAFVTTNSICQGQQVALLWPKVLGDRLEIFFAQQSFKWSNNASNNAAVICVIAGIKPISAGRKMLFNGELVKSVKNINPYLVEGNTLYVDRASSPISKQALMERGNHLTDGGHLILSPEESRNLIASDAGAELYIKKMVGAQEFIKGIERRCLFIEDDNCEEACLIPEISRRVKLVALARKESTKANTREVLSLSPHRFEHITGKDAKRVIVIPTVSSESRYWLPVGYFEDVIINAPNFAIYDAEILNIALLSSRLHLYWIASVCGRLKTDYRYSNTLGWNTFPIPPLTQQNKEDLMQCAKEILLAREHYFPSTIADMYDPKRMKTDFPLVHEAHERNDEVLERIYIGRRFKNDTERLEKLFDLYTKMTTKKGDKS